MSPGGAGDGERAAAPRGGWGGEPLVEMLHVLTMGMFLFSQFYGSLLYSLQVPLVFHFRW